MDSSIFAHIYTKLVEQIQLAVPEIKYINQDLGQLEHYEGGGKPAVAFPCVLIDIEQCSFSDAGRGVQEGDANILLRLAVVPYNDGSSLAPDEVRRKALYYYELEAKLHVALQLFTNSGRTTPMSRTMVATEKRPDMIRVRQVTYTCGFTDSSAADATTKTAKLTTVNQPAITITIP